MLVREKLVQVEEAAAKLGIHEVGGNNVGPWMTKFAAEVGLPPGLAWCAEYQSYELHQAAGHKLPIESASVEAFYETAKKNGWLVTEPARGDLACINWTQPGPPFGDHIVLVVAAPGRTGPFWQLNTIEGNTSSGAAGSQGDGDGVWLRTRKLPKAQVAFVRIPGVIADPPVRVPEKAAPKAPVKKASVPPTKPKAPKRKYVTLKKNLKLKKGQTAGFVPGHGYYAKEKP